MIHCGKRIGRRRVLRAGGVMAAAAASGLPLWALGRPAPAADYADLRMRIDGTLILPADADYADARRVWNGMIDRRPAAIARCASVADVQTALAFARTHDIPVAVRGGGHNVAGKAVRDDALVIDLALMQAVSIDPDRRIGRAQGGTRWATFDTATTEHGLMTTGGTIATTGVGGLTLGGGLGWLMRRHGLACDNLVAAEVVTATGDLLRASAADNPDLFWALRGGGGNFGVVTSFEFGLHTEEPILAGIATYPGAALGDTLRFFREYTAEAPEALTTITGVSVADNSLRGPERNVGWIGVCHTGEPEAAEERVRPIREFGPPLEDNIGAMSYRLVQTMFGSGHRTPHRVYWRSNFMTRLSDEVIDLIVRHADAGLRGENTAILLEHMGGAIRRLGEHDTAFSNRSAEYNVSVLTEWTEPADDAANVAWTRAFGDELEAFATGAGYVNYMTDDEGPERIRSTYETNLAQLIEVKRRYDPENFFSSNQNIKP